MGVGGMFGKAKGLVGQARHAAGRNPDKVRDGLGKAEQFVNKKTGGKFADAVAKGRQGVQGALGVTGDAKRGFEDEMRRDQRVDPVKADRLDRPEDIGKPGPI